MRWSLSVTNYGRSMVFSGYTGFLHQYIWPSRYNWNIVESDVTHHNHNPNYMAYTMYLINVKWIIASTTMHFDIYCVMLVVYRDDSSHISGGSDHCVWPEVTDVTGSDVTGKQPWSEVTSRKNVLRMPGISPRFFSYYSSSTKCTIVHDRHGYRKWRHQTSRDLNQSDHMRMHNRKLRNIRPIGAIHLKWRH
jgi:hypothetical protein